MPIQKCTKDGKPGFRWGKTGKCYTYSSKKSRKEAIAKAQNEQLDHNRKEFLKVIGK